MMMVLLLLQMLRSGGVKIGETTHIMMLESVDLIDISVSVGWANADVEVSWTAFSAVCSGLAQSKYLKMFWCFLRLIVDIFAIKLLYFFILMDSFTDSSYSIYYYDRTCLWYERINTWTFTKFIQGYIYIKKSKNVPHMSLIDFMLAAHKKSSF